MKIAQTLMCVAALLLSACGRSGANDGGAPPVQASHAPTPANGAEAAKQAAADALPKADLATPDSEYRAITGPEQILAYIHGLSPLAIDYGKIAEKLSQEYRSTGDGFKKQDIAKALAPRIDRMLADAKAHRYFVFKVRPELEAYQFGSHSFHTQLSNDATWRQWNNNDSEQLVFTNGDQFQQLKAPDEAAARQVEMLRSKNQWGAQAMEIYAYAQEPDLSSGALKAQIIKVKLIDPQGNTLLKQAANS